MEDTTEVTVELVRAAYEALTAALTSGDIAEMDEHWAEDLRWLAPGHNQLSGWKENRKEFFDFNRAAGELSDYSFYMDRYSIMIGDDYSTDLTLNTGTRPDGRRMEIDVAHTLRWRDGKAVEGKGAIFGDGTAQYDEFWA